MNHLPMHPMPRVPTLFHINSGGPATISCAEGIRYSSPARQRGAPPSFHASMVSLGPKADLTASKSNDGPILRNAVAYLVALTLARMPYDAESNAGLRNDNNNRARGSGRSADAVPGIPATTQRGHRGLETGDESTAIGALRSIISCLLSRGGDTQVRR